MQSLYVEDAEGSPKIMLFGRPDGGSVYILGTLGGKWAFLSIDELAINNGSGSVKLFANDNGGVVHVKKGDEMGAEIALDQYGGSISVYGKGDKGSRARMGVNEYGNGAVSTWDKNGYTLD